MGRTRAMTVQQTRSLLGWISRSELEGGGIEAVASGEGYSTEIQTTVNALARGKLIPLRWCGKGCEELGIQPGSQATEADAAKLLVHGHGLNGQPIPKKQTWKEKTAKEREEKVAYSIVLTAPKTLSLLLGHQDRRVRELVVAATEEAVKEAIGTLDQLATTRTKKAGYQTEKTKGVTAIYATHRTSSTGDPHIHVHIVASALVAKLDSDGVYRKLDSTALFGAANRSMHAAFTRSLQQEIAQRLTGMTFTACPTGCITAWEIESLLEGKEIMSKAKKHVLEVASHLEKDTKKWKQDELAWWVHRRDKRKLAEQIEHAIDERLAQGGEPEEEIIRYWREQLPQEVLEALDAIRPAENPVAQVPILEEVQEVLTAWRAKEITGDIEGFAAACRRVNEELTARMGGCYCAGDVTAYFASSLDIDQSFRLAADVLEQLVADGEVSMASGPEIFECIRQGFSSDTRVMHRALGAKAKVVPKKLIEREEEIIRHTKELGLEKKAETIDINPKETKGLTEDQRAALQMMAEGWGLVAIEGPAGSGKSHLLKYFCSLTDEKVVIVARNAKLALELSEELGVEGMTIAALRQKESAPPGVIVVDEASLVDQADWLEILNVVRQSEKTRIVAIGDIKQAQAIDRLAAWKSIVQQSQEIGRYGQLKKSYRCQKWETEHNHWRDGSLKVDEISEERIMESQLPTEIAKWAIARKATVITISNQEAAEMAEAIQTEMKVTPHPATLLRFGQGAGEGDWVRVRKNDYRKGIFNGQLLRVMSIQKNGTLVCSNRKGKWVTLDRDFTAEHVELSYATTADAAQGMTVERALVLMTGQWDGNRLYSGITRGKEPPIFAGSHVRERIEDALNEIRSEPVMTVREMVMQIETENAKERKRLRKLEKNKTNNTKNDQNDQASQGNTQDNTQKEEKMVRQFKFSIEESCEMVSKARFEPDLGLTFGPACEDTDWHWVSFGLDDNGKSYRIPCVWTSHEKTIADLSQTDEFWQREADIYQAVNPGASAEELQRIISLGREILYRAAYYHPVEPAETQPAQVRERTEQQVEPPPQIQWKPDFYR